jgi:hypothetical protein
VFWNMQGIVSTTKRDYSVQPANRYMYNTKHKSA